MYAMIRAFDLIRYHEVVVSLVGPGGPALETETLSIYLSKLYFATGQRSHAVFVSLAYLMVTAAIVIMVIRHPAIRRLLPWSHEIQLDDGENV
jgi:ABC-type sugar transport system permease subunit